MRGRAGPHLSTQGYIDYPPPRITPHFFAHERKNTKLLNFTSIFRYVLDNKAISMLMRRTTPTIRKVAKKIRASKAEGGSTDVMGPESSERSSRDQPR